MENLRSLNKMLHDTSASYLDLDKFTSPKTVMPAEEKDQLDAQTTTLLQNYMGSISLLAEQVTLLRKQSKGQMKNDSQLNIFWDRVLNSLKFDLDLVSTYQQELNEKRSSSLSYNSLKAKAQPVICSSNEMLRGAR